MTAPGSVPEPPRLRTRYRAAFIWALRWVLVPGLALILLAAGFSVLFPETARSWVDAASWRALVQVLAWRAGTGPFESRMRTESAMVPMRDGIRLATDLFLPESEGPFPVIVVRTPYTRGQGRPVGMFFARYGYAVAVQDVRGRHDSEGEFYPFRSESADGADLTHWLLEQPWCNGKISGFGGSYMGITQWAMAAGNPDVTSIAPLFATADLYSGIHPGGVFAKLTFLDWSLTSHGRYGSYAAARNIQRGFRHFPLREADDAAGYDIDFFNDWVDRPVPDEYWAQLNSRKRFSEFSAPAFIVGGWYDFFAEATIQDFLGLQAAAPPAVRQQTRLLMGPWSHEFFNPNLANYGIEPRWLELLPFEVVHDFKAWYDYSLKGLDNGWEQRAPVRVFVIGENVWRDEAAWPPAGAVTTSLYLGSTGTAGDDLESGRLDPAVPVLDQPADRFVYDPRDPVPTWGGRHGNHWNWGPSDQRGVEDRPDVLVYTSEALEEPLRVMGPVRTRLYASSSAPDTDFTAKLVDVFPDGKALIVCEGIVRARYRKGLEQPELLRPGAVELYEIPMGNTAVLFRAGHRVRLEVSSSNYPRYDANPNTGGEISRQREPQSATQHVYHSPEHPSVLELPVVAP